MVEEPTEPTDLMVRFGTRVSRFAFGARGLEIGVWGLGIGDWEVQVRDSGFGIENSNFTVGCEIRALGLGTGDWGVGVDGAGRNPRGRGAYRAHRSHGTPIPETRTRVHMMSSSKAAV